MSLSSGCTLDFDCRYVCFMKDEYAVFHLDLSIAVLNQTKNGCSVNDDCANFMSPAFVEELPNIAAYAYKDVHVWSAL